MKPRLIGAAVLIALAVIFLPMLVDGPEPQSGTSSVPLDIPKPPERNFETRELPLTPAAPAATAPAQTPASDDPNRVATVDVPYTPREDAAPETDATPAATAQATPPAAAPATSTTPPAATAPAATPPVATPAATSPDGRYAVNLGSYANLANARALIASMKAAGLPAYGDDVLSAGNPALRVRLGPFAQRGEAESARLNALRVRKDLPSSVVALDGEPASAAAAATPARPAVAAGFAVQIGALKSETDANALRDRARGAGFTTYVERVNTEAGALWRVRIGPEVQRANADRIKAEVKAKLQIDGNVVSHP